MPLWSELCAKIKQTNPVFCKQTRSALKKKNRLANKLDLLCKGKFNLQSNRKQFAKTKGQFEQKCSGVINIVFDKDK